MIIDPHKMIDDWNGRWVVESIDCEYCGHYTVSVYPICCERVECDGCGKWNSTAPIPEEELNV